jgi:hypothetical protein
MKSILLLLMAAGLLSGCAVVPYDASYAAPYGTYSVQPGYGAYGYGAPVYAAPPVYVGPPAYFGFGLNYRSGGHRGHGFGGGYRGHGFRDGFHGRH